MSPMVEGVLSVCCCLIIAAVAFASVCNMLDLQERKRERKERDQWDWP